MLFFEALTIGLPFCAFKIITGFYYDQKWLIALGIIDAIINLFNMVTLLFAKNKKLEACLLSLLVRLIKKPRPERKLSWEDLGNSLDVMLAFTLVSLMILKGNLPKLEADQLLIWNLSVVLNVLGAGFSRVYTSVWQLKPKKKTIGL